MKTTNIHPDYPSLCYPVSKLSKETSPVVRIVRCKATTGEWFLLENGTKVFVTRKDNKPIMWITGTDQTNTIENETSYEFHTIINAITGISIRNSKLCRKNKKCVNIS